MKERLKPAGRGRNAARRRPGIWLALLPALFVLSCSGKPSEGPPRRAIFSPNGEPLAGGALGFPTCAKALGGWLDRLDPARKGGISRDDFMADARAQFKAMDLNGDGILTPDVLTRYRAAYAIPPPPLRRSEMERDKAQQESSPRSGGQHGPGARPTARTGSPAGGDAARDVPDPVMAADTSLRLQVRADDFERHARKVFDALDTDRDGQLSRDEVLRPCALERPESSGGWFPFLDWF